MARKLVTSGKRTAAMKALRRDLVDLSTEFFLALGQPIDVQVLNGSSLTVRHHALKSQPLEDLRRFERYLASLGQCREAELC